MITKYLDNRSHFPTFPLFHALISAAGSRPQVSWRRRLRAARHNCQENRYPAELGRFSNALPCTEGAAKHAAQPATPAMPAIAATRAIQATAANDEGCQPAGENGYVVEPGRFSNALPRTEGGPRNNTDNTDNIDNIDKTTNGSENDNTDNMTTA